jgi:hypothetical protein
MGMILVPRLHIECEESAKQREESPPGLAEIHGAREKENLKAGIAGINSMIEEFTKRTALMRSTSA